LPAPHKRLSSPCLEALWKSIKTYVKIVGAAVKFKTGTSQQRSAMLPPMESTCCVYIFGGLMEAGVNAYF